MERVREREERESKRERKEIESKRERKRERESKREREIVLNKLLSAFICLNASISVRPSNRFHACMC